MKLNIGACDHHVPDYESCDIDPSPNTKHVFDVRITPWPFETESVEGIICSHLLEHLDELEAERFMYECYRILVPGSTLKIYVPNGPVVCDGFKAAIDRRKDIHLLIYGIVGRENWTHKYLYDFHALSALFKRTGYVNTQNLTNLEKDHHDKAWGFMPGKVSLKMTGEKPR